ncbi:putative cell wall protein [Mercurialis annua]|uniref:putative cell wall protein n=1 Tax=Mercurialis annua TaxID=3986 RepID=UPI0021604863|nr:putative cell wall protein [Mercurialis annua]
MAYTTKFSVLALLVLLAIFGQALAGRQIPDKSKDVDVKQPEFLFKSDRSFLIPGIGRVLVPAHPFLGKTLPHLDIPTYGPYTGTSGGNLPGGDDTFVPNPSSGGSVAPPAYP